MKRVTPFFYQCVALVVVEINAHPETDSSNLEYANEHRPFLELVQIDLFFGGLQQRFDLAFEVRQQLFLQVGYQKYSPQHSIHSLVAN